MVLVVSYFIRFLYIIISLNDISYKYFPHFIFVLIFKKFAVDIQEVLNLHLIKSVDLFFCTRSKKTGVDVWTSTIPIL